MKKRPPKLTFFDLPAGRKIAGKYQIIAKIGSGWEGEVYKVIEIRTGIERAAKLFFPHRNVRDKASKAYAIKLHNLRHCSILIQYHTKETITFHKTPVTVLISEYVDGVTLFEFLKLMPGKRLDPYKGIHLLYALAKGIEEIHLLNEYHGDIHTVNIIVNKFGLNIDLKLLDLFSFPASKKENTRDDICSLIQIFYECIGGAKRYSAQPPVIKNICCGLKRSLILKKFRSISHLREHLETMDCMEI